MQSKESTAGRWSATTPEANSTGRWICMVAEKTFTRRDHKKQMHIYITR